jgi:hypothetical protein
MDFENHAACNKTLGAPQGWDQSKLECAALPVRLALHNGLPLIESFWRPSPEELEHLNARGYVVLQVVSRSMPPVAIGVLP